MVDKNNKVTNERVDKIQHIITRQKYHRIYSFTKKMRISGNNLRVGNVEVVTVTLDK